MIIRFQIYVIRDRKYIDFRAILTKYVRIKPWKILKLMKRIRTEDIVRSCIYVE